MVLLAAPPAAGEDDPVAQGDAAWGRRAEGHRGSQPVAGPIEQAVAAYERAWKADPTRLEAAWKLLRALHFKGEFATADRAGKQQVFARGKEVSEAALDRLARHAGSRAKLDALKPAQAAKALAADPAARPVLLWSAVHWGLWGDAFGRLAAARQGVGDRVRRYAETLIALDERYENGGGHRVLGRLHTLAPKIPFVTGWVDRDLAESHLRRAVELGAENLDNHLFLAEALLEHHAAKKAQARAVLTRLLTESPSPDFAVEEAKTLENARALLAKHSG